MRRKWVSTAVLATALVMVGCGDDRDSVRIGSGSGNGDETNQTPNNQEDPPNNQEDPNNQSNNQPDDPPNNQSDNDDAIEYGEYYQASLGYDVEFYTYICECQYDNAEILPGDGFDSEQECLDNQLGDADEIDDIASCAQQISNEASEPPSWAEDVMDCRIDNHQSALSCLQDLDAAGDCSGDMLNQVGQCHAQTFGEGDGDDCDAYFEETGSDDGWMTIIEFDISSECLDG